MPKTATAKGFGKRKRKKTTLLENLKKKKVVEHQDEASSHGDFIPLSSSASEKKLAMLSCSDDSVLVPSNSNFVALHSHSNLSSFLADNSFCRCCNSHGTLHLSDQPTYKMGLFCRYTVTCSACEESFPYEPVSRDLNNTYVVAMRESGITYEQFSRFCEVAGQQKPFSRKTFSVISTDVFYSCRDNIFDHFRQVALQIRKKYEEIRGDVIDEEEILDIAVSFDGTWHKRGRTSHHGVGVCIEIETGFVIDFEVLTNFCSVCQRNDGASEDWKKMHKESGKCEKNFDGTSGAMEQESAKRIWNRSISKYGFRYVTMLSDGDSKSFLAVKDLGIYEVQKEECINHVSKRMYNGLLKLKNDHKGKNRIHGKGQMTEEMMRQFQSYYGKAIREYAKSGSSNIESLQRSILSILYHYTSCDSNPRHDYCPTGHDTWCKYNQLCLGIIDDLPPQPQPKLPKWIGDILKPLFERLSAKQLLERCARALTQNSNESFNQLIWQRCSKTYWAGHKSVFIATSLAALKFNQGASAVFSLLQETSSIQLTAAKKRDNTRLRCGSKEAIARKIKRRYRNRNKKKDLSYNPGGY